MELNLIYPAAGDPSLCAVVPDGKYADPVLLDFSTKLVMLTTVSFQLDPS